MWSCVAITCCLRHISTNLLHHQFIADFLSNFLLLVHIAIRIHLCSLFVELTEVKVLIICHLYNSITVYLIFTLVVIMLLHGSEFFNLFELISIQVLQFAYV
jgi:hypothetical protein